MKKFSLPSFVMILLAFLLLSSCGAGKKALTTETAKDPYMTFDNLNHDFGTIKVGEKKTHVYTFTNTHSGDIVLELVSGCQCTEVEYAKGKTFKTGETGTIKATFDSNKEEERGTLNKTIDILLENTDPKTGYQIIKELKYQVTVVE